jgi:hypothetical protein
MAVNREEVRVEKRKTVQIQMPRLRRIGRGRPDVHLQKLRRRENAHPGV